MQIDIPSHLSDDALMSKLKSLARGEREAIARLIAHLAELDARRLYLGEGFSSLFTYCVEVLRLSEPAAYNRIEGRPGGSRSFCKCSARAPSAWRRCGCSRAI